jgi:hypothetical protein
MMRPADVNLESGRWDWGSGTIQRSGLVPAPVLIQDSIVQAILQRGLRATYETLSAHELAWCRVIVESPHHKGALGITPLPASGMAAFYSAAAQMISWLSSVSHASKWVAEKSTQHHKEDGKRATEGVNNDLNFFRSSSINYVLNIFRSSSIEQQLFVSMFNP